MYFTRTRIKIGPVDYAIENAQHLEGLKPHSDKGIGR